VKWLSNHPNAYTFEVATTTSWFPKSGYYRVQVSNGEVVAATDSTGKAQPTFTVTLDYIWDQILAARANGELNSVAFNRRGIPLESDMGPWAVGGGVRFSVRNFVQGR
jgi:hypothetical protein